jgi:hypothetical protein
MSPIYSRVHKADDDPPSRRCREKLVQEPPAYCRDASINMGLQTIISLDEDDFGELSKLSQFFEGDPRAKEISRQRAGAPAVGVSPLS